ncbi:hypothetical protein RV134_320133 [Roseovarius sp. EC-HK134]|nr:hypothetical protein RV420_380062 [Roseovarius sp. EC-SD190]VVT23424.1 hypothetical protein RV134_320133 [Roseovarius sp. EC-HK134]
MQRPVLRDGCSCSCCSVTAKFAVNYSEVYSNGVFKEGELRSLVECLLHLGHVNRSSMCKRNSPQPCNLYDRCRLPEVM